MTFWGTTAKGSSFLLGEPEEAMLAYDRDAPADLFKAVFPADRLWEELREVTAYHGGKAVFRGTVDEQNMKLSGSGCRVQLVCRSLEALLLDNEAPPTPLKNPSLDLLERRLLQPLGFLKILGDRESKRGELKVQKGDSCWTVLETFCREHLGTTPYVDPAGVLHCEGQARETLELEDILEAEISFQPCRRISTVWQQSYRGSYDTPYRDPEAAQTRVRYLSMQSGKDPRKLLRDGEENSFQITVECAGAHWPVRGAEASVTLPAVGRYENCPIESAVYYRNGRGERTRFTLKRGKERGQTCG